MLIFDKKQPYILFDIFDQENIHIHFVLLLTEEKWTIFLPLMIQFLDLVWIARGTL